MSAQDDTTFNLSPICRISHIVLMGMGEPLDNYEQVVRFLRIVTDLKGYNLSVRNITLSTCGLPDKIRNLADEGLPVTLALSLHAATDEKRREIMPIAKQHSIGDLLAACDYYFDHTGRRVSYEYTLMEGINDSLDDARTLGRLLAHRQAHVNLIPVNSTSKSIPSNYRYVAPAISRSVTSETSDQLHSKMATFKNVLEKFHINVTIRRSMGQDILAACGQLRREHMK
jgi:23S rRNA (adenine2503-C2)-methyltransferase